MENNTYNTLIQLKDLFDKGILTEEEYNKEKKRLLNEETPVPESQEKGAEKAEQENPETKKKTPKGIKVLSHILFALIVLMSLFHLVFFAGGGNPAIFVIVAGVFFIAALLFEIIFAGKRKNKTTRFVAMAIIFVLSAVMLILSIVFVYFNRDFYCIYRLIWKLQSQYGEENVTVNKIYIISSEELETFTAKDNLGKELVSYEGIVTRICIDWTYMDSLELKTVGFCNYNHNLEDEYTYTSEDLALAIFKSIGYDGDYPEAVQAAFVASYEKKNEAFIPTDEELDSWTCVSKLFVWGEL